MARRVTLSVVLNDGDDEEVFYDVAADDGSAVSLVTVVGMVELVKALVIEQG